MTKSNVTRKAALEFAIANLPENEYTAVLANMLEQISKPRKAVVSKARKMNENLAAKVCENLPADGLTSKDIVALGFPEITTTQKAAAVMRVAEELGLATKVKDGKKISYVPAATDDVEGE